MPSPPRKKEKESLWHKFTQQKLPAWQPVLTPKGVVITFYACALIIGLIGFLILVAVSGVRRISFDYSRVDELKEGDEFGSAVSLEEGVEFVKSGSLKLIAWKTHNAEQKIPERTTVGILLLIVFEKRFLCCCMGSLVVTRGLLSSSTNRLQGSNR